MPHGHPGAADNRPGVVAGLTGTKALGVVSGRNGYGEGKMRSRGSTGCNNPANRYDLSRTEPAEHCGIPTRFIKASLVDLPTDGFYFSLGARKYFSSFTSWEFPDINNPQVDPLSRLEYPWDQIVRRSQGRLYR